VECESESEMVAAEAFVQNMKKHEHPYVVSYISTFREGKNVIIVMESFEKGTLGMCLDFLAEQGLRLEEHVYFFFHFCFGLFLNLEDFTNFFPIITRD
jgi:serine/threonine protein kinase